MFSMQNTTQSTGLLYMQPSYWRVSMWPTRSQPFFTPPLQIMPCLHGQPFCPRPCDADDHWPTQNDSKMVVVFADVYVDCMLHSKYPRKNPGTVETDVPVPSSGMVWEGDVDPVPIYSPATIHGLGQILFVWSQTRNLEITSKTPQTWFRQTINWQQTMVQNNCSRRNGAFGICSYSTWTRTNRSTNRSTNHISKSIPLFVASFVCDIFFWLRSILNRSPPSGSDGHSQSSSILQIKQIQYCIQRKQIVSFVGWYQILLQIGLYKYVHGIH